MKTYHQLFTLVMLILVVLTAIFVIRIVLLTKNDDVTNKTHSENVHLTKSLPAQSFGEYIIDNPLLNF